MRNLFNVHCSTLQIQLFLRIAIYQDTWHLNKWLEPAHRVLTSQLFSSFSENYRIMKIMVDRIRCPMFLSTISCKLPLSLSFILNYCFFLNWDANILSPGYTGKLVCQTTPQTNMLRPFLTLGPAHLLLQTVCREFVLEPAGSPQTDKKSQINSRCIANAKLAVCPSNHCFKLVWTNVEWFDKPVCTCNRGFSNKGQGLWIGLLTRCPLYLSKASVWGMPETWCWAAPHRLPWRSVGSWQPARPWEKLTLLRRTIQLRHFYIKIPKPQFLVPQLKNNLVKMEFTNKIY